MNLILDIDKPKETKINKQVIPLQAQLVGQESSQQITNDQEIVDEFALKYIQRDKQYDISQSDSKIEMTKQTCVLLCNGLKGLEIHNDAQELKKEITFLVLFKSVNSLIKIDGIDEEFINDVYQRIKSMNNLTDSAKQHFDTQRERNKNEMTNPYILQGIIRDYNSIYYKDVVMKSIMKAKNDDAISIKSNSLQSIRSTTSYYRNLDTSKIQKSEMNLDDPFSLVDIEMKIYNQEYECDEDIVTDMLKIMRIINQKNDLFVMKRYDSTVKRCTFDILSDDGAQKKLSKAKWDGPRKKNLKLWSLFQECAGVFRLRDISFISDDKDVFSIFQGWKHKQLEEFSIESIQLYLDLIKEVIAANDNNIYEYILNWISFILQHPGIKTRVAIVIRGVQGTGKNTFTHILCDLMAGYSTKNITDIEEITGNFNDVIEKKSLIVLNELKNFTEQRALNSNALKSIITDDVQRINENFVARRDSQNVSNLIFISNNYCPVKIEATDRRYLVCQTPDAHRHNFEHFSKIHQAIKQAGFYDSLYTFFMKRDISKANLQVIPMTDAKKDIQKVSKSPVENFVVKYLQQLIQGMECSQALFYKPRELTEFQFKAQLKAICDYERKNAPKSNCAKKIGYYKLKPGLIQDYESMKEEDNEINSDDDDEIYNLKIIPNNQEGDVINE
ncbi:MAG: hypothetical protein EZS28_035665 [Streblomastix strix]|uniref:NrS-1 polymerase-like helicase domain-containing protein n=1 Tax=Streblomastix strix TaxID=222440 RepID=A0A5J4UDZ7_9EUKA|nr:MAG: hypothetical protein EZS28_035665 [Streblomastix strix]